MSKKRHEEHEEHVNHERWLVTYADMITLLMVLFIVLFAMSTVDQKKFNALKAGLAAGFGQSTSILDGSSSILEEPGSSMTPPINPNQVQDNPTIQEIKTQAVSNAQREANQSAYDEAGLEANRLLEIERKVKKALAKEGLLDDVVTKIDGRGLTVSLISRHIVFQSNLASMSPRGRRIVTTLAPVLRRLTDRIQIEGHTNQAKGAPKYYASDWDLSSARAVTVLRLLNERLGVREDHLVAVGFGHVKPLVDPKKPGSQELNKRVDIVVLSALTEQNKALLDRVVYDRDKAVSDAAKVAQAQAAAAQAAAHPKTDRNARAIAAEKAHAATAETRHSDTVHD